ncbi:putative monooxygenase [Aspergillus bombycis]|uniref:Putative monooxygenase n=1 Tax=Aspergillus bombycis TaxID=109264 RepID=A0A1F8AH27_9EURO|nr:putative monooxygenase [Aspergillus bombycis]OGM51014.1 putative monooxygenase [Aspergillus bombycis]
MALRPCKVLIVGGGIAGLSLALMLEKNAVDYLLLEAYPNIVTDVGAGICMMPNGLRVLDQLGCYEDLLSHTRNPVTSVSWRDLEGKALGSIDGSTTSERYGYSYLWMDRKALLEVLYSRISDKSKVLTQKRVATVHHTENSVEVTTTDGSRYSSDILVGADGTHSRIRQEMVRLAGTLGLQDDYGDETPATYSCIFGVSTGVPGIPPGCLDFVVNEQSSHIVGSGPDNRTYWFLMAHMGQTFHGEDIPQLSNKEQDALAQKHWNDHIRPDVRFSDLYKNRISTIYTPMRECVDRHWHLNRVMLIGDAVHKMLPSIGQGGSQAVESAAALTNSLMEVLSKPSSLGAPSTTELSSIFQQVQDIRAARLSQMMDMAHRRQQMDAMETPELRDTILNKFPKLLPGVAIQRWDATFLSGVSLRMLDIPARPRTAIFHDERRKDEGSTEKTARI